MKTKILALFFIGIILNACSKDGSNNSSGGVSPSGTAGSLARFAIVNDHLYTVTPNNIKIFDISNNANPVYELDQRIGFGIETIFPLGNTLFMGSETGMYMYDISNSTSPAYISTYQHILSCDPVVANDNYAYVTLSNEETRCARGVAQLEVIDIRNKKSPQVAKVFPMSNPKGLTLNGNDLFVCDDNVKWYDTTDNVNLKLKATINQKAHDAIAVGKTLMLIGENGLTQYDYSTSTPQLLSKIQLGATQ